MWLRGKGLPDIPALKKDKMKLLISLKRTVLKAATTQCQITRVVSMYFNCVHCCERQPFLPSQRLKTVGLPSHLVSCALATQKQPKSGYAPTNYTLTHTDKNLT